MSVILVEADRPGVSYMDVGAKMGITLWFPSQTVLLICLCTIFFTTKKVVLRPQIPPRQIVISLIFNKLIWSDKHSMGFEDFFAVPRDRRTLINSRRRAGNTSIILSNSGIEFLLSFRTPRMASVMRSIVPKSGSAMNLSC